MEGQVRAFLASLEAQSAYSPSTCLAYTNDMRCFLEYLHRALGRDPLLSDFNDQQVANFLQAERQAGRRPSTLLRRRACLKRFASFLQQEAPDWEPAFRSNSSLIEEAISDPSPEQIPQSLSPAQVGALWAVLEASPRPRARRDQAILALLLETGLTVGALIALDVSDLDLTTGRLRLHPENGQSAWISLGKAGESLQQYVKDGRPELNYHPGEPALFISQTGGRMTRQGVWQVLRQWGHKARLPVTLSPRLARHTAASNLARAGRPVAEIQAMLGHSNPLSTQALLRRLAAAPLNAGQTQGAENPGWGLS